MPPNESIPPQVAMIMSLLWLAFMVGIVGSYIIMLIALWKGMRAHQKIAEVLEKISDRLKIQ